MKNTVKNISIKALLVFSLLAIALVNPTKIDAATGEYYTYARSSSYDATVLRPVSTHKQYAYTQQQLRITNYSNYNDFQKAFYNEYVAGSYGQTATTVGNDGSKINKELASLWNNRYSQPVIVGDIYWYTSYGKDGYEAGSRRWSHIFVGSSASNVSKRFAVCSNVFYYKQAYGGPY